MSALERLQRAATLAEIDPAAFSMRVRVRMVTNFTDEVLRKLFIGACVEERIHPTVLAVPYKQYGMALQDPSNALWADDVQATFVFFDASPYAHNEFLSDPLHFDHVMDGIQRLIAHTQGIVVLHPFIHAALLDERGNRLAGAFSDLVHRAEERMMALAAEYPNVRICDVNRIVHRMGETQARDLRNAHAFDLPFTNDFSHALADAWLSILRPLAGRVRKCVVVDLDQTLWGGVVGEAGVDGIALGPDYPGNAFVHFQRALLELHGRGIMLAVNSRNNPADVDEVFAKHPSMILKKDHFASLQVNWDNKADNLVRIAQELNIGLDSLVFFDDDAANRALVRQTLPEVLVPEIDPAAPEQYVATLLSLRVFSDALPTEEDLARNQMMLEERKRSDVKQTVVDVVEYIASLDLRLTIERNNALSVPRVAQLTQKTNQFNLTTIRCTESEIAERMKDGFVYAMRARDRFGDYGLTGVAVLAGAGATVKLENSLLSCRVLGRGVEFAFLDAVIRDAATRGATEMRARFIPTAKNAPAAHFLSAVGFVAESTDANGSVHYRLSFADYLHSPPAGLHSSIRVEFL